MIILIFILTTFITIYMYSFIINYININDGQAIDYSISKKLFLSGVSSILMLLLYIKIGVCFEFWSYFILMLPLILIAYIDYETKYVYEIISRPLVIISIIICLINLILENSTLEGVLGSIIALAVILLFTKLNYVGEGDVEVLAATFLMLNNVLILPGILLILSFGISGIASIFLLIFKKVDLNYRKPLCPSIAVATYILIVLI